MPECDRVIQTHLQHTKTDINKATNNLVRHILQLIVGSVGIGAGVIIAADALKLGAPLVLIAVAFIIGGLSFVFCSIAAENLPYDYSWLKELRSGKQNH